MIPCIMGQLYFVFAEGEPCLVKCMKEVVPDNSSGFIS